MNRSASKVNELTLGKDLNELAHSFIRELAMAFKKMAIYGSDHPLSRKAVMPPFATLGQIFHYKNFLSLNVHRGELFVFNIALKESIFYTQVMQFVQILDLRSVLFGRNVTLEELIIFVDALVKRETLYDPKYRLSNHLKENKVENIMVNSSMGIDLFEEHKLYRGEVDGNYTVRRLALDQIGDDLHRVAQLLVADSDITEFGIDFDVDIIKYLIPERIASFSVNEFVDIIVEAAKSSKDEDKKQYMALLALAMSHPDSHSIRSQLNTDESIENEVQSVANPVISIKDESRDKVDKLLDNLFKPKFESNDILDFAHSFSRLLKTGQQVKGTEITHNLLLRLEGSEVRERHMALSLLDGSISAVQSTQDTIILENIIREVITRLNSKTETFEYSELIRLLFHKCLQMNCLAHIAKLLTAMSNRRQVKENVTVYDSLAIKKALEHIDHMELIESIIDKLVEARHEDAGHLRTILCSIASEKVALALSRIISHPTRQVRQHALKILSELGNPSLNVFSRMMADDNYFMRPDDRQELPDAKWYVVRNTIFVLGLLGDVRAIDALRIRMSDSDVRVRREIICTVEKIGGDEAVDLLVLMADDPSPEIRSAAIIAIGLIGNTEATRLVIDIAHRQPTEVVKAITALGKLGGDEASQYLSRLLKDEVEINRLTDGKVSKEELRVAVIKALTSIGGKEVKSEIEDYRDGLSKTQKIFFKNSPVNKAINDALSRR